MPCCRPLLALRITTIALFVAFFASKHSKTSSSVQNPQSTAIPMFASPWLNVPQECGVRPTLAGEGGESAHGADRNRSLGTVFLLQAAGVGWALPNIRSLVGHDTVSVMTTENLAPIDWLVPLTKDPWPDGASVAPAVPMVILDKIADPQNLAR